MESYQPRIDRRTTLKWMLAGLGSAGLTTACGQPNVPDPGAFSADEASTALRLGLPKAVSGPGYGTDPDMNDGLVTWARTMTQGQRDLVAALGDIVLPATDGLPSASEVGVPDFIDEWVSSPYDRTQGDRESCFALFEWLEGEAVTASAASFAAAAPDIQTALLDRIAFKDRIEPGLEDHAKGFATFRNLAASA